MLEWDRRLLPKKQDVADVGGRGQRVLAAGCIDDALLRLGDSYWASLNPNLVSFIKRSLKSLLANEGDSYTNELCREGESLLEADENLGGGAYDAVIAVLTAMEIRDSESNAAKCLEAMSYAYQVILSMRVLSGLDTERTEAEVRAVEQDDPSCTAVLNRQLEMLDMVQRGEPIHIRFA